jgi:hypothetical protein
VLIPAVVVVITAMMMYVIVLSIGTGSSTNGLFFLCCMFSVMVLRSVPVPVPVPAITKGASNWLVRKID